MQLKNCARRAARRESGYSRKRYTGTASLGQWAPQQALELAPCCAIKAGATCLPQHVGGFQLRLLERGLRLARNPERDKVCGSGGESPPFIDTSCVIGLSPQHRFVYLVYTLAEHRPQGSQRFAAAGWEVLPDHTGRGYQHTESGRGADSRVTSSKYLAGQESREE
jgi:hypothetical protein